MGSMTSMLPIRSYMTMLRTLNPSVNDNLIADIMQQINGFITEINSSFEELEDLSSYEKEDFRVLFGKFVRSFMNLDGMFRINRLAIKGKNMLDITDADQVYHVDWWTIMERKLIGQYINMPLRYGAPTLVWTTSARAMESQYIRTTMCCVLKSLVDDDKRRGIWLSPYDNAVDTLYTDYLRERKI